VDYLRGLKENVIMGRLIPAGTGMEYYRRVKIAGEDLEEELMQETEVPAADGIEGYGGRDPAPLLRRPHRSRRHREPSKRNSSHTTRNSRRAGFGLPMIAVVECSQVRRAQEAGCAMNRPN